MHVSEISEERVEDPRNVLKASQDVQVEVISLDPQERKIGLSIKAAQRKAEVSAAQGYAGGSDMGAKLGDLFAQAKDKKARRRAARLATRAKRITTNSRRRFLCGLLAEAA